MTAAFHSRLKRGLVGVSIAALACAAAVTWYAAKGEAASAKPDVPEAKLVKAVTVKPAPQADSRLAIGEIRPQRESDLGFRLSGKLVQRTAAVGQMIRKGEVLARIEDQDYRNRLRNAEADVAAAQAVLVEASAAEARL
ncbi:biotin/lipoyl-binding protein, partial [Mesorhizobium sp.]